MPKKILVLPGDGIGPEIIAEAVKVLECLGQDFGLGIELESASVGGTAYDGAGTPLPAIASAADYARVLDALRAELPRPRPYDDLGLLERATIPGPYLALADFLLAAGRASDAGSCWFHGPVGCLLGGGQAAEQAINRRVES